MFYRVVIFPLLGSNSEPTTEMKSKFPLQMLQEKVIFYLGTVADQCMRDLVLQIPMNIFLLLLRQIKINHLRLNKASKHVNA